MYVFRNKGQQKLADVKHSKWKYRKMTGLLTIPCIRMDPHWRITRNISELQKHRLCILHVKFLLESESRLK